MATNYPTSVGPNDTILVNVSGVKGGANGRSMPTTVVQEFRKLEDLLNAYAPQAAAQPLDTNYLKDLAATNPIKLQQVLADYGASLSQSPAALPDRIIKAVCDMMSKEKGVLISSKDPGDSVWYVNPGDLQLTVVKHQADGYQWFVNGSAPFGLS